MTKDTKKESLEKTKQIRQPKQSRSLDKKIKIINAALELFCEKGYYSTTTNEIAKRAQVSIGSLYAYFQDKDTIFFEVLDHYHAKFFNAKSDAFLHPDRMKTDLRGWLEMLFSGLILVHEESKEFNRELNVLSYYNPKVAGILAQNQKETLRQATDYFKQISQDYRFDDLEAVSTVVFDLISSTVDRIVFGENEIEKERLVASAIDLVELYIQSKRK